MERSLREAIIVDYAKRRPGYGFEGVGEGVGAGGAAGEVEAGPRRGTMRSSHLRNPLCGDEVALRIELSPGAPPRVARLRWEGRGCTVSQASAAMLAVRAEGLTPAELRDRAREVRELIALPEPAEERSATGEAAPESEPDVVALAGIGRLPLRARCAGLAWEALEAALGGGGDGDIRAGDGDAPDRVNGPGRAPH